MVQLCTRLPGVAHQGGRKPTFLKVLSPARIDPPIHVEYYVMDRSVSYHPIRRRRTYFAFRRGVDLQLYIFQCYPLDFVEQSVPEA